MYDDQTLCTAEADPDKSHLALSFYSTHTTISKRGLRTLGLSTEDDGSNRRRSKKLPARQARAASQAEAATATPSIEPSATTQDDYEKDLEQTEFDNGYVLRTEYLLGMADAVS